MTPAAPTAAFELLLLRHAHAEPASGMQHDRDRDLSARGIEEADAAAHWLAAQPRPGRIVCSPARRTVQTAERVLARLGAIEQVEFEPLYEAELRHLLEAIERHRDVPVLLLVGHNPGLESLVALLTTGQSGDHRGMPPGGVARLAFDADGGIEPGSARLTAFWSP
jgi:phosphohistidine phosphatase